FATCVQRVIRAAHLRAVGAALRQWNAQCYPHRRTVRGLADERKGIVALGGVVEVGIERERGKQRGLGRLRLVFGGSYAEFRCLDVEVVALSERQPFIETRRVGADHREGLTE